MLHGKKAQDIYVILSPDGSSVVRDPGLGRPWSSPNKKIAEHFAKGIPGDVKVVTLDVAIRSITFHPANLPKHLPRGFRIPEA